MVALFGPGTSFVIDAGTFAVQRGVHLRDPNAPGPHHPREARRAYRGAARGHGVRAHPDVAVGHAGRGVAAVLFFMGPMQVLIPTSSRTAWMPGSGSYGTILALEGLGAIAMSLWVGRAGCRAARSAG